jgi:glycosyltransferase involved in cell wall biosynthesis
VIRHGETGLLVEPDNADALARALRRLIDDAALRDRMGRAASAHVAVTFSVEKMADRFVAALG